MASSGSSFFIATISALPFTTRAISRLSSPSRRFPQLTQSKVWRWKLKCVPSQPTQDPESESDAAPSPSTSSSSSSSSSISTYTWCAALGGIGFLETAYLTYLKLTNSDAFCPVGGGNCGDILNSDYALIFGVPLPLFGMIAYGVVAALGLQLRGNTVESGALQKSESHLILVASSTAMAAASGYFLYILTTKFSGPFSCSYCLASAVLSFSLFFITLKDFGLQETRKNLGLQLFISSLVIFVLSASYASAPPATSSQAEINLPYFTTEITTPSSPFAISLARHLHSIGAKMYGAFWCSHCVEQKQMFGKEASELLDYVECFPQGYKKGTKIAKACADARIEGFPTWEINGQVLSGDQELSELAQVSGFEFDESG